MVGLNVTGDEDGNALPPAIKQPIKTEHIPNPLHKYASYSYAWSLWWLDIGDFNNLMDSTDVDTAVAWEPSSKSYVIAEDSGLFPDRRLPGVLPVNYNIQDVKFNTIIAPNRQTRSSNMIDGSLTIVEPLGVTFLDTLAIAAARFTSSKVNAGNYTMYPYMLQLDFFGYNDNGQSIPLGSGNFRKRFPIRILTCALEANSSGSTYKIDFVPYSHLGHSPEKATIPKDISVTASTVGEFFNFLEAYINGFYLIDAFEKKHCLYADSIHFDIDPDIKKSSITKGKEIPLSSANPNATGIDIKNANFNIKHGTSLLAIIDRVLAQSEFLISQLSDNAKTTVDAQTKIFNAYKTTVKTKITGIDPGGTPQDGVYDTKRMNWPVAITYSISQHPSWKGEHPSAPTLPDSTSYTTKNYNYLYTGQNIDVIDFKLQFDMTYYNAILGYPAQKSSTNATPDTKTDREATTRQDFVFNPGLLLGNDPNISPSRYRHVVTDQNLTFGGGLINNPSAQKAAGVVKSMYSRPGGDMVMIDLTIIGDPTLIKQDDWLYVASPSKSGVYNKWNTLSQAAFAAKYGHLRMDAGDVITTVTVNSTIDLDIDLTNQGLMYPQLGVNNQYQSLFSGQYRIIWIENTFAQGKFTQILTMARYINGESAKLFNRTETDTRDGQTNPAGEQSQNNQSQVIQSTPEVGQPSPTSVNPTTTATGTAAYDEQGNVVGYDSTR